MKSLQNQYNLIKEGKGNKEIFLKEVKAQFPQYISNVQTFDQVIHSLTEKGIINETITLVSANNPVGKDWFKIFNENVAATVKDTDKEVVDKETAGYDYKAKNNNNISTAEMLKGYYVEMRDPKNVEKTEEQIKAIVVKNLEKDPLFYVKDGEFGIRGVGYTPEHPGLPKDIYGNYALGIEPKVKLTGKYKSSGMEPVKLNESLDGEEKYVIFSYPYGEPEKKELYQDNNTLKYAKQLVFRYNNDDDSERFGYMKKSDWEAQHGSLSETKHSDQADLKIYKSELNLINKVKAKGEKHEKRKAELEKKIADLESKMNEAMFGSSDGDYEADQEAEQMAYYYYDKGLEAYSEGDFLRAKNFRSTALRYGSSLGWGEQDLPPYGDETLTEAKAKRAIEKHLAQIDRMAEVAAWDHRIGKVQEKIEELTNKMTVTEGDDVKEYVDKKAVKELKKDIALLEKRKALYEKKKAQAAKKVTDKSAMQTAAGEGTTVMEEKEEEKPFTPPSDPDRDRVFASMKRDTAPKPKKESWSGMVRELINKKNLKLK
jgi:hypothetical protein